MPLTTTGAVATVSVAVPQLSVAVAVPSAASIAAAVGLQPNVNADPVGVITGAVTSFGHVTVRDAVDVLVPSVAVHVRVCEYVLPVRITAPVVADNVAVPQLSVAVAVPRAASIADAVGLQLKVSVDPVGVITGGVTSFGQVTVRDAVDVLVPSVAVQVRVCEYVLPVSMTAPVVDDSVAVPQLSVAVALPRAASMAAAVGLHVKLSVDPVAVITGGVTSFGQVTVRDAVDVLMPSVAVHVRVCEYVLPVSTTDAVATVSAGVPQLSVAVALPRAASIAVAVGLQFSVRPEPVAVITGLMGSSTVTFALQVDVLPFTVNVTVTVLAPRFEQLKLVFDSCIFCTPQVPTVALVTIAGVSVAFPPASRLRVALLQTGWNEAAFTNTYSSFTS